MGRASKQQLSVSKPCFSLGVGTALMESGNKILCVAQLIGQWPSSLSRVQLVVLRSRFPNLYSSDGQAESCNLKFLTSVVCVEFGWNRMMENTWCQPFVI